MNTDQSPSPVPNEHVVATVAAQVEAIDMLLPLARRSVCVFDVDLAHMGWNTQARATALDAFLRRDPQARLRIVVHDTQYLEQSCARIANLLLRHAEAIEIRRSGPRARGAMDPLADRRRAALRAPLSHRSAACRRCAWSSRRVRGRSSSGSRRSGPPASPAWAPPCLGL